MCIQHSQKSMLGFRDFCLRLRAVEKGYPEAGLGCLCCSPLFVSQPHGVSLFHLLSRKPCCHPLSGLSWQAQDVALFLTDMVQRMDQVLLLNRVVYVSCMCLHICVSVCLSISCAMARVEVRERPWRPVLPLNLALIQVPSGLGVFLRGDNLTKRRTLQSPSHTQHTHTPTTRQTSALRSGSWPSSEDNNLSGRS